MSNYIKCKHCKKNHARPEYAKIMPDIILCSECADKIINIVHKAHRGKYFSWHDSEYEIIRSKVKTKKKIGAKLRTQVYERDGYRCVKCSTHLNLTCDHIHPESLGGETSLSNLQTMCKSCNSKKGVSI